MTWYVWLPFYWKRKDESINDKVAASLVRIDKCVTIKSNGKGKDDWPSCFHAEQTDSFEKLFLSTLVLYHRATRE